MSCFIMYGYSANICIYIIYIHMIICVYININLCVYIYTDIQETCTFQYVHHNVFLFIKVPLD